MSAIALLAALALSAAPKSPATPTQLKLDVKPSSAVIYVDGKRKGTAAKVHVVKLSPGRHTIRIVNGLDEHSEVVSLKRGESKIWQWVFEDDRRPRSGETAALEPNTELDAPAQE